ncbi:hypothetical protein Stsp01_39400 [Streptomyces sp. NBRC 13847]|nr:hypothetical protein Stsp01_39400 [Streptomyces sp. NBRC 13847]
MVADAEVSDAEGTGAWGAGARFAAGGVGARDAVVGVDARGAAGAVRSWWAASFMGCLASTLTGTQCGPVVRFTVAATIRTAGPFSKGEVGDRHGRTQGARGRAPQP